MHNDLSCEVCKTEPAVGVASCLAAQPMSIAYGRNCLNYTAEAIWIIGATVECCGGPENIAEWFWNLRTFRDGVYLSSEQLFLRQKTMDMI